MKILLGHLIGDYLLQNNWMALNKSKHKGLGWFTCFVHCLLYTFAVCLTTWNFTILWIALVFLSHFLIDKFGIAEFYLKTINGRSIEKFMNNKENETYTPQVGLRAGLVILVYVVCDNTMHLTIMFYGQKLLTGEF
jgi:preprotein translocase subunit SecY